MPPVFSKLFRPAFGVAFLLALFWGMAISVSPRVGVTADEPGHLTAGYSYWSLSDYRLNPENGSLPMRLAAAPLLSMPLQFPALDRDVWLGANTAGVADEFFFLGANPADDMLFAGRAMVALAGMFTLWLIWRWAGGLFGPRAGWLALGLSAFCPALLAHSGLATSDITVTACFLAALSAIWRLLHRVTWGRLAVASLAAGLLFLAKMSGVLLVPLAAAMFSVRCLRPAPLVVKLTSRPRWIRRRMAIAGVAFAALVTMAAGSVTVLWAGYGFRYEGFNRERSAAQGYFFSWDVVLERQPVPWHDDSALAQFVTPRRPPAETALTRLVGWARDHRLLPEAFLWGFAHTLKFADERPAFFRGEFSKTGWRMFFPTAFVMKTPASALALFGVGILSLAFVARPLRGLSVGAPRPKRGWLYRAAPLLLFFAAYWTLALNMHLNIGHRHILPTYPVVYVIASAAALWLGSAVRRWALVGIALAVAVHVVESVRARPFYLAYFQPLFGGPERAYRTFVDSSLDWGQGLPDLAAWQQRLHASGDRSRLFLSYSGVDLPRRHGIEATRFGDEGYDLETRTYPARVEGGWFAIGATLFQRVYLPVRGRWTQAHEELYGTLNRRLAASSASSDPAQRARVVRDARDYELLQFGRLCHFLQERAPDDFVGASLLLFRLSDAEVNVALYAPLEELNRARADARQRSR